MPLLGKNDVKNEGAKARAIILVGGPSKATSFRPLSLRQPKALFPVGGKPLLYHQIAMLANSGVVDEIFLLGFFEQDQFSPFLSTIQQEFSIKIKYLREYENLGTAGGMYHFRDLILRGNPSSIFMIHSDVICSFSLREMNKFHLEKKSICTMLSSKVSKESVHRLGNLIINEETGAVVHFVEKPTSFVSNIINCGVYLLDAPGIFDALSHIMKVNEHKSEKPDYLMMETDVIPTLLGDKQVFAYQDLIFWKQIKTPASVIEANKLLIQHMEHLSKSNLYPNAALDNCFVHQSAKVHPTAKIGPNVSINEYCVIGAGVRIKEAIVLPNVVIEENCYLANCIVGWNTTVGKWSRIEGSLDEPESVTKNGIKTSSISILAGENTVSNEIMLRNCIVLPNKNLRASYHNEILM